MKKVMNQLAARLGPQLCGLAEAVAVTAASECKKSYYQPKAPIAVIDLKKDER